MTTDDDIAQDVRSEAALDTCHCCDVPVDPPIFNRPGLPALAYRVGTYATFLEHMKTALPLASAPEAGGRPLAALTTRDLDDPTIALLDAAAVLGDILTFYQERIANEGFLRTATERRSVLELAREIGYELNPGVAASTYLAFTVDKPRASIPGLPEPSRVPVPAGQKVQSVPGPGQAPQTFETTAPIVAHVDWNEMRARSTQRQELAVDATSRVLYRADPESKQTTIASSLWLDGTQTNLRPGDLLWVAVGPGYWSQDPVPGLAQGIACVFVADVEVNYDEKRTRVDLSQKNAEDAPSYFNPPQSPGAVSLTPAPLDLDTVRQKIVGRDWDEVDLRAYIAVQNWDEKKLLALVAQAVATAPSAADVHVFRAKTGMFGNQALPWKQIDAGYASGSNPWSPWDGSVSIYEGSDGTKWSDKYDVEVLLDRVQPLAVGGFAAFGGGAGSPPMPMQITKVLDVSAVDFAMSAKVTGLSVEAPPWTGLSSTLGGDMRDTTAYVQSEALTLVDAPIDEPVGDVEKTATELMLDRMVLGLAPGQKVILSGTIANDDESSNTTASEVCEIAQVTHSRGYTTLHFVNALEHPYVRSSIVVNGNVAPATHGDTVPHEVLGSGDSSRENQTFRLARAPLTYVAAATSSGGQDTLTVRVDGVAWQEVPTLFGAGPTDPVYTVRHGNDASTTLRFGDGRAGARLPTGANNVVATYRSGLGLAGNLDAETISILATRPHGVRGGLNPVPASGGAAPEQLADARGNAPLAVRTLGRVVSLDDFTDFARGFAIVGKALAVPLWSGETQIVHITVAGADGGPIDPQGEPWSDLVSGIAGHSDSSHLIELANFKKVYFKLTADVVVDPRRDRPTVVAAVTTRMREAFSFAARELAQPVTEAEVIEIVQSVPGVIAVEVSKLHRADESPGLGGTLPAAGAHFDAGAIVPAELLLLHPVGLSLVGVNP